MYKEKITDKEAFSLLCIFMLGTSLIIGSGGTAKQDAWLSVLVGAAMAVPLFWLYAKLQSRFLGRDLYEILELGFGKVLGKLIILLYTWYAFHLGALVLRNFGEFINVVAMPETPLFVPLITIGLLSIMASRSGVEALARISAYLLPMVLALIVIVQILALQDIEFSNLKPVLEEGWGRIVKGGFSLFAFPFAETILFSGIFSALKTPKSSHKVYFGALILTSVVLVMVTVRNIGILGTFQGQPYFPSYSAVSRISVGEFLQRIEVVVSFVFTLGVFIKCGVCLVVASKGVARIFNLHDYRSVVIQLGLLMIYLSYFIYDNIMMMKYWAFEIYQYYAFPFQVILPVIILIVAWIRSGLTSRRSPA